MTTELRRPNPCENLNHRRTPAPVRHCRACGGIVNERVDAQQCRETHHATARRQRAAYCVDCGAQLIFDR